MMVPKCKMHCTYTVVNDLTMFCRVNNFTAPVLSLSLRSQSLLEVHGVLHVGIQLLVECRLGAGHILI